MRVNVYSQEITDEVVLVEKESNTGQIYNAVMFMLHSSERLHHPPQDDDRSGVTFWLPKSPERRELLAKTFENAARKIRDTIPEIVHTKLKINLDEPVETNEGREVRLLGGMAADAKSFADWYVFEFTPLKGPVTHILANEYGETLVPNVQLRNKRK